MWQTSRICGPCLETAPCPHNVACGQPLAQVELLRSLVAVFGSIKAGLPAAATNEKKMPPLAADLQLWRIGFDALGARPYLLAGHDPYAAERQYVREFLAARLHVALAPAGSAVAPQPPAELEQWLCNDADWMLPPGRYC